MSSLTHSSCDFGQKKTDHDSQMIGEKKFFCRLFLAFLGSQNHHGERNDVKKWRKISQQQQQQQERREEVHSNNRPAYYQIVEKRNLLSFLFYLSSTYVVVQ
jgi:hypothetical protein